VGFWTSATLVAATLTTGLMAGLFAAFWYAIMPGLARASDLAFVEGMQRINVAILNGWFGLCFAGALVFSVVAAILHAGAERRAVLPWIVAGAVLYLVVLVVTVAANVPLNDRLDAAGDPDRIGDLHAVRAQFEAAWVRWNAVRTLACTVSFGCLTGPWSCTAAWPADGTGRPWRRQRRDLRAPSRRSSGSADRLGRRAVTKPARAASRRSRRTR